MKTMRAWLLIPLILLPGCVRTIGSVVTVPFKAAGQAADWATTSQDEADRNRGREIRKREQRACKNCRAIDGDRAREDCVRYRLRTGSSD